MKTTFVPSYTLASGAILELWDQEADHLLDDPDMTPDIFWEAVSRLTPPSEEGVSVIDLADLGLSGRSALVEVEEVNLFAFRRGQRAPIPVVNHPGVTTSKLVVRTSPLEEGFQFLSCWWGEAIKPQPIGWGVNPLTEEGLQLRQEYLQFWRTHAFALGVYPIEGEPFTSTWEEVFAKWGEVYHARWEDRSYYGGR